MVTQWGEGGDVPVPGDYDGDRRADHATYRPSAGQWWIRRSMGGVTSVTAGTASDIPVPADYDGDDRADPAVFRPSTADWLIFPSGSPTSPGRQWGHLNDIPVPKRPQ